MGLLAAGDAGLANVRFGVDLSRRRRRHVPLDPRPPDPHGGILDALVVRLNQREISGLTP